jgi:hypothetical protein
MHYQCIALFLVILLAVAMNAATNIVPVLHPLQCQTKTMHLGDVILPRRGQKVLRGGANSPMMQPSLRGQNSHRTWCYVIRTQQHQPTMPGAETIQTEGPHHGKTDYDVYFFVDGKTVAGRFMMVKIGDLMVCAPKLDSNLHQNTIGKLSSRAFDWCNKNAMVPV